MATTVYLPQGLIDELDRRARRLGVSRNHLIMRAVQKELSDLSWPPGFFDRFRGADPGLVQTIERMERDMARPPASKKGPTP
jgi:hypothetical protein